MKAILLGLLFALASIQIAAAQNIKVNGSLKNRDGYAVVLVAKNGDSYSANVKKGKFSISGVKKSALKGATLQLIDSAGRYAGPVVFLDKGSKVGTSFSGKFDGKKKLITLGKLALKDGYAVIPKSVAKNSAKFFGKANVIAEAGKPIGAGEQGLVSTFSSESKTRAASVNQEGGDEDLDGIPDAFDADDDGDLVLDAADPDSSGADVPYTSLFLDFRKTANANVRDGLSDQLIDSIVGGENVFNLAVFISLPPEQFSAVTDSYVICDDSLVYCRKDSPTAVFAGITESSDDFRGKNWDELLTSDGFPRLEKVSRLGALVASIQPRVGRDQFSPGDVFRVVAKAGDREVVTKTMSLAPYFVSVPAIKNYDAGFGEVDVDYGSVSPTVGSIPGASPSDPIVLSEDGLMTMTFWRPQRQAIRSDEEGYYDWGDLNYGVTVGSAQVTCAGLFSNVSDELEEDETPLGAGGSFRFDQGANGNPYRDLFGDSEADPESLLSFTVDLKGCLSRGGGSSGVHAVTLNASGEQVTGGQISSGQLFYVQIP